MTDATGPAFSAELTLDDDGAVVGCAFVDHRDLLRPDVSPEARGTGPFDRVERTVRRVPGGMNVTRTRVRGAPGQGQRREVVTADTPQQWLRMMARAWGVVDATCPGASASSLVGGPLIPQLVWPAQDHAPADVADLRTALERIEPFLLTLDPGAVRTVLDGFLERDHAPGYALLDRTVTPDAPLAVAFAWQPHWRLLLAARTKRGPDELVSAVRDGSDALRRLVAAWVDDETGPRDGEVATALRLADLIERSPADARAAVRAAAIQRNGRHRDPALCLTGAIAGLPWDWVPREAEGWRALVACLPALEHARSQAEVADRAALLDAKGDWARFAVRLSAARGETPKRLGTALSGLRDLQVAYADQVLRPALETAGWDARCSRLDPVSAARAILQDGRRLCRMLETSRRWHAAQAGMRATLTAFAPLPGVPDGWPRAWPDGRHDDVVVRELTTRGELIDEGASEPDALGVRGLGHCVGGYAGLCMSGAGRILTVRHLRDGVETRLSTAEVRWNRGASVRQHLGVGNSQPPRDAAMALRAYLADLSSGAVTVDVGALRPVAGVDRAYVRAGYDHRVTGAWELARDLWDPFVPRRLRGLSRDRLVRTVMAVTHRSWRREPVDVAD